jgi:7-alpha-hydroxysteroid dehydrogenase
MSFSIAGKTAVVTGAAGGVGLAIAREFAANGANVIFADRDETRLEKEVADTDPAGGRVRLFAGDFREKLAVANLLSFALDDFDRVDVLVNASRLVTPSDPLSEQADEVEALLRHNFLAALRLSQAFARRMIQQAEGAAGAPPAPAGAIVNISSIASGRAHPALLGYAVSAAAIDQMTRSLAVALAPHRIRVNAVAFGSVMSASLQTALRDREDLRGDIALHTPLGRIAAPSEVAEVVRFLASDASRFMTGQILTVDGGRTLLDAVASAIH